MGKLALGVLVVLTMFTGATVSRGCRDAWHSATHLPYFPIRDMRNTVAVLPQKTLMVLPDTASVPVTGRELDPGRDVLAATLRNPTVPADLDSSIVRGERKFKITCVPCHGAKMEGNGPVAALFMPPPDLLAATTRGRTDGYIYSYIRHGGVVMPSYGAQTTRQEAWDLINYIRRMQRTSPR